MASAAAQLTPTDNSDALAKKPPQSPMAQYRADMDTVEQQHQESSARLKDEYAMTVPQYTPPPPPQQAQSNPAEIWGGLAMAMAALGGFMTRSHASTAFNAAAGVVQAYRQRDAEAAQAAFERWKVSNENMLKSMQFAQERLKTDIELAKADEAHGLAKANADLKAMGIDLQQIRTTADLERVHAEIQHLSLENGTIMDEAAEKHEKAVQFMKLQASPEWKQAVATNNIGAQQALIKQFDLNIGNKSTGLARSLPAAFAQKYLQEHPDATAEELQDAAAEYAERSSEARTTGTRVGAASVAVEEVKTFAKQAIDASRAVPRGDDKAISWMVQQGQTVSSDPNLQKFLIATDALANARARAISPSGQPHLEDQRKSRELLSTLIGEKGYEAGVSQFVKEAEGVQQSARRAKAALTGTEAQSQIGEAIKAGHSAKGQPNGARLKNAQGQVIGIAKDGEWEPPDDVESDQ